MMPLPDTNDRPPAASLGESLAAALAWWREAGIDTAYIDAPQDWLAAETPRPPTKAAQAAQTAGLPTPPPKAPRVSAELPTAQPIAEDRANWPEKLEDFAPWWLGETTLAPRGAKRLAPSGPAGAELMVLVPMPAEDDGDALLSGRAGRLLDAMLAAMGFASNAVYRASALPARIALPDWAGLGAAGLAAVLARHVALAAPKRLLVFGHGDISALLGHGSAHSAHHLRAFNHEKGSVPANYVVDLETLLARPSWKAGVWQHWLDGAASEAGIA